MLRLGRSWVACYCMVVHAFCGCSSFKLGIDMLVDFEHNRQGAHVADLSTAPLPTACHSAFIDRLFPDMEDSERLTYVLQFGFCLIFEHITTSTYTAVQLWFILLPG